MGRKKGYQQPLMKEMSQVNSFGEYVFSTDAPTRKPSGMPSFLHSFGRPHSTNSLGQSALSSDKVIGASYSHFDFSSKGKTSDFRKSTSSLRRNSQSSETKSVGSSSSAKNSPRKPWRTNLDNDDDWDDQIQTVSQKTERLDLSAASKSPYPQVDLPVVVDAILEDPITITRFANKADGRIDKYCIVLNCATVNLADLKKLAWNGVPAKLRAPVWQLLLGYLPTNNSRRAATLERKRREYRVGIEKAFDSKTTKDQAVWHQIGLDIPRTNPHLKLYGNTCAQKSLEKILYLWAVRHPASGYVQGINDLCTPLYQTFLGFYVDLSIEEVDPSTLSENIITAIEADTFWCLTKILDTIQDNYIHQQPGIRRQVKELENLTARIDEQLKEHIIQEGIDFMQFSFRWMNCLLMRELKMGLIVRMWDTYISEFPTGFSEFHVYVCCAFLMKFSDELKEMAFQDIIMYLQDTTKTQNWQVKDVELILSEAFIWQTLYKDATAHLK